jgi:diacylglycerol O-acyltransferase
MPFSLREPPNKLEEFQLNNNFAMMTVPLDLVDDFKHGLSKVKKDIDKLKKSIDPFGMLFALKLNSLFPTLIAKLISMSMANKLSMVFSNVPGPKTPLIFQGKSGKKLVFFVPALGSLSCGISIVSYVDLIKVGCISDES